MTTTEQPALCDGGAPADPIIATRLKPMLKYEAKYVPCHPAKRDNCDNCTWAIHGGEGKALRRTAFKRVVVGVEDLRLCSPCKALWSHEDGTDQREAKKNAKARQGRRR